MKKKEFFLVLLLLLGVTGVFFYKVFLHGFVPFPGDLLISEYAPWKSYSFLGYNPGSYPEKAQYFDVIRQMYPWRTLANNLIQHGQFPLWNPYNFSGSPLLANFQSAIFYPLNFFYFLFPQINAWTLQIFLQPFLASFFTYLFARKIKIGMTGSLLAGISFGFCLFMNVFLEYNIVGQVIAWLPLSLYFAERLIEKIKRLDIFLFILTLVFAFFAGHIQIFGFSALFILFYIVYRVNVQDWKQKKKLNYFLFFVSCFILTFGISAIQLFPTIDLTLNSAHISQSYQFLMHTLLLQPYQILLFLSPDIFGNPATHNYLISDTYPGNAVYIGLIPFVFAVGSFVQQKMNATQKFFSVSSIVLLLLFLRTPFAELFYKLQIPFFSTSSPTNGIFLLSFCLSILCGIGIEFWLKKNSRSFKFIIFSVALILLGGGGFFYFSHNPILSFKNFIYSLILVFCFIVLFILSERLNKKKIASFIFITITLFDLFYFFQKFNPFVPKQLVFPKTDITSWIKNNTGINRVWGYGSARVEANFQTEDSYYSPDGYDPLYPKQYGEFIQYSREGKIGGSFDNSSRSDATVAPGFGETELATNYHRQRVLDLLGVKYILDRFENASTEKTFPSDTFGLVHKENGWRIFENKKALPRFFLTSKYVVASTRDELEKLLNSQDFNLRTLVLTQKPRMNLSTSKQSSVELNTYSPNKVSFTTNSDGNQLLFLSDTYYPGWKVFVDGADAPLLKADYSFRAVEVPNGMHSVKFSFEPESFSLGKKTSIISIVLLLGFVALTQKKLKYEK